ncbi:hypothetical protein EDF62_1589 [Leucobacter luti]|uniref:Uncharacterized protein n=1 Tax=Leucobacter luti TaxID=340320 RepID=A0A4R6RYY4_9MICO|nr:hypothetical protein [Leucobacter luti]TDP92382.1 hypothetical protein EDF62_1589 [Leucobacter luti]
MTQVHAWGWAARRARGMLVVAAEPGERLQQVWARANRPLYAVRATALAALLTAIVCFAASIPAPPAFWVIATVAALTWTVALLRTGALKGYDPDHWAWVQATDICATSRELRQVVIALESDPDSAELREQLYDLITAHTERNHEH